MKPGSSDVAARRPVVFPALQSTGDEHIDSKAAAEVEMIREIAEGLFHEKREATLSTYNHFRKICRSMETTNDECLKD